jgi:tetratricopeptide (TPR) repeat protein
MRKEANDLTRRTLLSDTIQQPSRGWFETTECALLQLVGKRAGQQIAVDPGRRIFAIHRSPTIFEMLNIEDGECSEFALEVIPVGRMQADVFKIQSEVAESVAQKLRVKLLPAVKERLDKRPTENLEAYNLYLQGRYYYYYSQPSSDRWTKAIDAFSRAIEKDPNFALAYTGLANAY